MIIHLHDCGKPNIGDDINAWFWERTLGPQVKSCLPESLLVGIGTVLNSKLPEAPAYHVLGSGVGYTDGGFRPCQNMEVHWVRGPMSAHHLGLPASSAITDPAALISCLEPQNDKQVHRASFMPHIDVDTDACRRTVTDLGLNYISPSDDQDKIFADIAGSDVLLTSAMHGAIFADSYRTPWIPVVSDEKVLQFKWQDWTASMNLPYEPVRLPALWDSQRHDLRSKMSAALKERVFRSALTRAQRNGKPLLSAERLFAERVSQLREAMESFSSAYLR